MRFLIFSIIFIIVYSAPSKEKRELSHKDPHDYKIDANDQHGGSNHELASIDGHVHKSHGHDNPGGNNAECCIPNEKKKRYNFLVSCYPVQPDTKCNKYPYFEYRDLSVIECCMEDHMHEKLEDFMPKCVKVKQCYVPYSVIKFKDI